MPGEKTRDGREVGAIRGLIASMLSLLQQPDVTHVAAATDQVIESFRNQLYPGYKTGEGIPPDLWAQFPLAEEALRALGMVVWPMRELEADDALASAAAKFAEEVEQILILSPDKDLAQCVRGDRVVTFDRIRKRRYDEAGVLEKFGVEPRSIPDYLALTGDSADGIPGLPGWGAKSSAAVLRAHRHLEDIPDDPRQWRVPVRGAARLAAMLAGHRAEATLYKNLATLRTDAKLTERLSDLQWHGVPRGRFRALCEDLGLRGLINRPTRWID